MVRIVTDTGASLPQSVRQQYGIEVVALQVTFGSRTFHDEIDLTSEQFYRLLKESKDHPITSQPAVGDFAETYRRLLQSGEEIVSIHLPRKLSGTAGSADAAKAMLDGELAGGAPITVLDVPNVSMAQGLVVLEGAKAAQRGASRTEVVEAVERLAPRINLVLLLDTLEYLRRGGRIGRGQALLGAVFNVKPLLEVKDGAVEPLERLRSRAAGLRRVIELVDERAGGGRLHAAILHGAAAEDAKKLEADLRGRFNLIEFYMSDIGPVLASHAGPGAVGIAFYKE